MKKILIVALMLILAIGVVSAADVGFNDCTKRDNVCIEHDWVCDWWWRGNCLDWDWECTEYELQCVESIGNSISVPNGDSGIGLDTINKMLDGWQTKKDFYSEGGYNLYMLEQVNGLLVDRDDQFLALVRLGPNADKLALEHEAARIKAKRTGEFVWTSDGYQCSATMCVLFYTYIDPDMVTAAPPEDENSFHAAAERARQATCTTDLEYWNKRCEETGSIRSCNIAENLKEFCQ